MSPPNLECSRCDAGCWWWSISIGALSIVGGGQFSIGAPAIVGGGFAIGAPAIVGGEFAIGAPAIVGGQFASQFGAPATVVIPLGAWMLLILFWFGRTPLVLLKL
jgi:hypothetical protein